MRNVKSRCFFFGSFVFHEALNPRTLDRADAPKSTPELFFKQVKTWKDSKDSLPPPAIVSGGLSARVFVTTSQI